MAAKATPGPWRGAALPSTRPSLGRSPEGGSRHPVSAWETSFLGGGVGARLLPGLQGARRGLGFHANRDSQCKQTPRSFLSEVGTPDARVMGGHNSSGKFTFWGSGCPRYGLNCGLPGSEMGEGGGACGVLSPLCPLGISLHSKSVPVSQALAWGSGGK